MAMRGPQSRAVQIPAPTGGWNARDPLAAMKATDAIVLENMIPGTGGVSLRGGSYTRAKGIPGAVSALLRYTPPGDGERLFACSGAGIYDVTGVQGAVGAPVFTTATSDRWQGVNFGTPGGNFLVAANGVDPAMQWNAAAAKWTPLSLVGDPAPGQYALDGSKLMCPTVFASRLWFVERNSLRAWFLPVQQIASQAPTSQGQTINTAYAIDLSAQCRLGGHLVAMGVYTRDGGTGIDDYAVFVTSAGEVVIYSGTDPVSASTWQIVGVFRIAPPIGNRCLEQAGSDLAILTQQGVLPLSRILPLEASEDASVAITDKIKGAFQDAYRAAPKAFGWSIGQYPGASLVFVNVPLPQGGFHQFVMNAMTGAWCRFTGLAAVCWELLGDVLYFGTADGRVVQYDIGSTDDGAAIQAPVMPAYSSWKSLGQKRFTLARPLFTGPVGYAPAVAVMVDYDTARPSLPSGPVPNAGTPWRSRWGSPWGPKLAPAAQWQGVRGLGQVGTVFVQIVAKNPFRLDHIDLLFEAGGIL